MNLACDMKNTNDSEQPTMQEILDQSHDFSTNRMLDEIIKAAESMRIMLAQSEPAQRDQTKIDEYVRTIGYYAEALPLNRNRLDLRP